MDKAKEAPTSGLLHSEEFFLDTNFPLPIFPFIRTGVRWKSRIIVKYGYLKSIGGIPSIRGMIPEALPPFLNEVCTHMARCHVFPSPPNHILLNEYMPGQGIMVCLCSHPPFNLCVAL